jgi:tetratricopeptide (TPR) repeat protein
VLGRHQEALDEFKRVVELEPRHVDANLKVGLEYLSLGNKQAAIQQYYILKEFAPKEAEQLHNLIYR